MILYIVTMDFITTTIHPPTPYPIDTDPTTPLSSPLHLVSPFLYMGFVWILQRSPTCPKSQTMLWLRWLHNLGLSIASAVMLGSGLMGLARDTPKTESLHALICEPINISNPIVRQYTQFANHAFLYSKYWEWFDTVFLHLGGRAISTLQYTHHMSTAFLVATNTSDMYSPSWVIFCSLNCFVHVPMYWYFAYPKGALRPFAAWITRIQIIQHIICIGVSAYANYRIYAHDDCYHGSRHGIQFALALYGMYLFYFTTFYISRYLGAPVTKQWTA